MHPAHDIPSNLTLDPGQGDRPDDRFAHIVAHASDGVLLIDPHHPAVEWPIVYCNEAACRMNGSPAAELLGQPMRALEPTPASFPAGPAYLAELRAAGSDRRELQHRRADGTTIWVETALSLVQIGGHEYLLRLDRDITAHKQAEAYLHRRVALDQCATAVARQLSDLPTDQTDEGIGLALRRIGEFLGVDRVCVFLTSPDGQAISCSHEWCGRGVPAQLGAAQQLPTSHMAWFNQSIAHDQMIHVGDVAGLAPGPERSMLEARGVRSMLAVPFMRAGEPAGYVGCDSVGHQRAWTSEDIALLLLVSESVGRAIERQQVVHTLRISNARYRMVTEHATDIISLHDPSGVCHYCSPTAQSVLGYHPDEIVGQTPFGLVHPDDRDTAIMRGKVHDTGAITTTYRMRHKAGHYIWIETSARAVCDPASGQIREIVAVTRDVDARKHYEAQIEQLAYYDPLTLLVNRRRFHDELGRALLQVGRTSEQVALLYLDLDHFKKVNDTLGHDAGDELLVQVAARLAAQVRQGDTLARLGGDEFAVLLAGISDESVAAMIAQRIVAQVVQPFEVRGQTIHLGVSIGIACAPQNGRTFEDLLKHADIAMYRAKSQGEGYCFYDPSLSAYSRERLQLEDELRRAIAGDELVLHYQPIVDLRDGRRVGVEALVRWQHPARGLLMPGAFVPLAEECGLIRSLDRWVMLAALRQLAAWHAAGMTQSVSINLSARTLHERELVGYVGACLRKTGAPPEFAVVEVTESALMHDREAASRVLEELKQLGMRVALDDFGSGHAALAYLKWLPVDEVKIDRSFVQGIGHDPRDEGVVRAIVAMSQGLRVDVVAEGVNDPHQREWLQSIGCFLAQGYGLGRPAPPETYHPR